MLVESCSCHGLEAPARVVALGRHPGESLQGIGWPKHRHYVHQSSSRCLTAPATLTPGWPWRGEPIAFSVDAKDFVGGIRSRVQFGYRQGVAGRVGLVSGCTRPDVGEGCTIDAFCPICAIATQQASENLGHPVLPMMA